MPTDLAPLKNKKAGNSILSQEWNTIVGELEALISKLDCTTVPGELTVNGTFLLGFGQSARLALGAASSKLSLGGKGTFEIDAPNIAGGRLTVTNDGNVGIGTADPLGTLHIAKKADGAVGPTLRLENPANKVDDKARIEFADNGASRAALEWNLMNGGAATWNFLDTFSGERSRLFIDNTGNVGIGTPNPAATLHIAKAGAVVQGKGGIGPTLRLENPANKEDDKARIEFADNGASRAALEWNLMNGGAATWNFLDTFSGGLSRLFIDNTGNVGIGTTTPKFAKLDIRDQDTVVQIRKTMSTLVTGKGNGGAIYFGVDNENSSETPTAAIETSWGEGVNPQIAIGVTREFTGRNLGANIVLDFAGNITMRQGTTSCLSVGTGGNVGIGKGNLTVAGNLTLGAQKSIIGSSHMNIDCERLFVHNTVGMTISKVNGGSGNFDVQGDLTVAGRFFATVETIEMIDATENGEPSNRWAVPGHSVHTWFKERLKNAPNGSIAKVLASHRNIPDWAREGMFWGAKHSDGKIHYGWKPVVDHTTIVVV